MRYLLLLYDDEATGTPTTEEEGAAEMAKWIAYTEAITSEGIMRGGEALEPTSTATTVRVREGVTEVTDGPFAETREQLGGYYVVECDTLDQAVEAARRIPSVGRGSVEVRPIMELGD